MKKKQELAFLGFTKANTPIVSGRLDIILDMSKSDPIPLNRKSKRSIRKILKNLLSDKTNSRSKTAKNRRNRLKRK